MAKALAFYAMDYGTSCGTVFTIGEAAKHRFITKERPRTAGTRKNNNSHDFSDREGYLFPIETLITKGYGKAYPIPYEVVRLANEESAKNGSNSLDNNQQFKIGEYGEIIIRLMFELGHISEDVQSVVTHNDRAAQFQSMSDMTVTMTDGKQIEIDAKSDRGARKSNNLYVQKSIKINRPKIDINRVRLAIKCSQNVLTEITVLSGDFVGSANTVLLGTLRLALANSTNAQGLGHSWTLDHSSFINKWSGGFMPAAKDLYEDLISTCEIADGEYIIVVTETLQVATGSSIITGGILE